MEYFGDEFPDAMTQHEYRFRLKNGLCMSKSRHRRNCGALDSDTEEEWDRYIEDLWEQRKLTADKVNNFLIFALGWWLIYMIFSHCS